MQKLEERNTYTPTDIPHVSGNCDRILNRTETSVHAVSTYGTAIRVCDVNWRNGLEETLSVSGLKTSSNNRSHIKNTAARIIHGFQRYDKVLWNKIECFVFGRRKTGYFELRKLDGIKIHASAKIKDLTLL